MELPAGASTSTYTYTGTGYANSDAVTTTYGYDAFGARVYQIVATTSTSTYPFKFFSVSSTTKSSTNWATSTEYFFNGDTLLGTIDQQFKNGVATGTAKTRYVHPDHLGSTNDTYGDGCLWPALGTVGEIISEWWATWRGLTCRPAGDPP